MNDNPLVAFGADRRDRCLCAVRGKRLQSSLGEVDGAWRYWLCGGSEHPSVDKTPFEVTRSFGGLKSKLESHVSYLEPHGVYSPSWRSYILSVSDLIPALKTDLSEVENMVFESAANLGPVCQYMLPESLKYEHLDILRPFLSKPDPLSFPQA